MAKYEAELDMGNPDHSQSVVVKLVGRDKRVLDVGCSTGYIAAGLASRGCKVAGVELEAEWAEQARPHLFDLVIGDLEQLDLVEHFGEESFDVVVFADVLEHLRDPEPVLRQARRLLAPRGSLVVSMPNVAHGDLRLSLLSGRWDYTPLGLLDETHLRFFTRASTEALMARTGFSTSELRRVRVPLFGSEVGVRPEQFDPAVVEQLRRDPDHETYQYVFRAVKDDVDADVARLHEAVEDARVQVAALQAERDALAGRAAAAQAELASAQAEVEALRSTRTYRWSGAPRSAWARVRAGLGPRRLG